MAFPSVISSFTNPAATDKLNSPSHSSIETAQNNELIQIEKVLGITGDSSVVGTINTAIFSPGSDGGGHIQGVNKGGTNQTAYAKGDLLVATSSSVLAKLGVGTNNQVLTADNSQSAGLKWSTPATGTNALSLIPVYGGNTAVTAAANTLSSTLALIGLEQVLFPITVNKITVDLNTNFTNGNIGLAFYNENGASSVFSATLALSASAGPNSTNVSSIVLAAGNYLVAVCDKTSGAALNFWKDSAPTTNLTGSVAGKANFSGTLPISGGVLPTSFASITAAADKALVLRLDN